MRQPFGRWARDYVEDTFHLDSRLSRSLSELVRRPGGLTREYLEGRRSQYVRPFRLYLMGSVVYFLLWALLPPTGVFHVGESGRGEVLAGIVLDVPPPGGPPRPGLNGVLDARTRAFIERAPATANERMARKFGDLLPRTMFLLVPVFALLLAGLYRGPGRFYAEHFVLALHLHAFAFLALGLERLVPLAPLKLALLGWMGAYAFLALRRVYGEGRLRTGLKLALLGLAYLTVLSVALIGVAYVALGEG